MGLAAAITGKDTVEDLTTMEAIAVATMEVITIRIVMTVGPTTLEVMVLYRVVGIIVT